MRTATNKSEERPARQHVRRRQGALCPCDTNSGALEFDVTLLGQARAQGLFLGVEVWRLDVARLDVALHGSAEVAASLPRTSRKKRAFPPLSGGAASPGVCLPTMHAPPLLSMRDLAR